MRAALTSITARATSSARAITPGRLPLLSSPVSANAAAGPQLRGPAAISARSSQLLKPAGSLKSQGRLAQRRALTRGGSRIIVRAASSAAPGPDAGASSAGGSSSAPNAVGSIARVLIIGGSGAVGSAAAVHLLSSSPQPLQVVLVGRDAERGRARVAEISVEVGPSTLSGKGHALEFRQLDWRDSKALEAALEGTSAVLHTAGPYAGQHPDILAACIKGGVPCYVDLSDPLEFISAAKDMSEDAVSGGTMALLSSGAFPGFSNVLAMECASRLEHPVRDLSFRYFTAGLGGSGPVNLLITNQGFGDPVPTYQDGKLTPAMVAGLEAEQVNFFIDETDESASRVGERTVWSWPFPEVATVAEAMRVSNSSTVKMGTAPDAWNVIMGLMVRVLPRTWWKSNAFCQWMADFSEPMVRFTDRFVGETHCMRIDVTDAEGNVSTAVQGHDSFRRVVGQSCAEFALDLLGRHGEQGGSSWRPGVYLPEQLFTDDHQQEREAILDRLAVLPGTFTYRFSAAGRPESSSMQV